MTGPRLTLSSIYRLILVALCVAAVVGVCWTLKQWSPR